MTSTNSAKVERPLHQTGIELIQFVVDQGCVPANSLAFEKPQDFLAERFTGSLGVLLQDPRDPPKKLCFGRMIRPARRRHIVTIWVKNETREATSTRWVIEIFGKENEPKATDLINKIKEQFGVTVSTKLKDPDVVYERLRGE